MFKKIIIKISLVVIIVGAAFAAYYYLLTPKQIACPADAKICPDGASVVRQGPKCEFAVCPNDNGQVCIQVITPAKNRQTGECKDFPTPCDVPAGWDKVESCVTADTANWTIYKNYQLGFELKYPAKLFLNNKLDAGNINFDQDGKRYDGVYIGKMIYGCSLQIYKSSVKPQNKDSLIIGDDIITSGTMSFLVMMTAARITDNIVAECRQIYNQILSTFKFIDADETANWQTYRNEKYGFEFKYPEIYSMKNNDNIKPEATQEFRDLKTDCWLHLDFCANPTPAFSVSYEKNTSKIDLLNYLISSINYPKESFSAIKINDKNFVKLEAREMYQSDSYYIENGDNVIGLTFYLKENGLSEKQIKNIFKTFEFINK